MKKQEWTKELMTGIKELDDQHKELMKHMSGIIDKLEKRHDKQHVLRQLKEIQVSANRHFDNEEKLMDNSDYPEKAGHKRLHAEFMEEFFRMAGRILNGETGPELAAAFKENLADWCVLHIQKNDLKLVPYLSRPGTRTFF